MEICCPHYYCWRDLHSFSSSLQFFNSLQGFFYFLFFCVFSEEAHESWKEILSCGRYKSPLLHPSKTTGNVERHRISEDTKGYSSSGTIIKNYSSSTSENITLDDPLVNPFSRKKDFKSEPSDRNVDIVSNEMEMESIGVSALCIL